MLLKKQDSAEGVQCLTMCVNKRGEESKMIHMQLLVCNQEYSERIGKKVVTEVI